MQATDPTPPSRALEWILALPLGLLIALVLFWILATNGHYFFGEFLAIFLVVFGVLFFVRLQYRQSRRNYRRSRMQANSPALILRQRYARGEISREQFQAMMRDLREGRVPPDNQQA